MIVLLGVAGATILGFLLARSMIETGGSGWAWMIRGATDVLAREVSNRIDRSPSDDAEEENERHGLED